MANLNAPARGSSAPTGLTARDFWGLLELSRIPDEIRNLMLQVKAGEEALAAEKVSMRSEQTRLLDAERQLNERKENLDLSWANLRGEQKELDERRAAFAEKQKTAAADAEAVLNAQMARSAELDKREAELGLRSEELGRGWQALESSEQKSLAATEDANKALAAREAAVAEREAKADQLANLLKQV